MVKGRKTLPDSVKRMKGEYRPSRFYEKDSMEITRVVKLPIAKNLNKTEKRIYKSVGNHLLNLRVLDIGNFDKFVQYVKMTALYYDISASMPKIEDLIHTVIDKRGNETTQLKALVKERNTALKASNALAAEFGLTPSSQVKILKNISPVKKSPLEDFFGE